MNERILELARQVWPDPNISHVNHMKFAELIVKECCSIIETDLETNQIKAETDNEGRIWVNAQLTFSEVIKLHFGVE